MTVKEELEIVQKAKNNIHSFSEIYNLYFDRIYRYCQNRLPTRELAEDAVSNVFFKAVKGIKDFDTSQGVKFQSWLYKTAHNVIIDIYRKNNKSIDLDDEVIDSADNENVSDKEASVYYFKIQIVKVLSQLKKRYQEIISLKFYSELDINEISEVLKIPPKRVSVLLYRAQKSFERKFKKKFPKSEIFEKDTRYK